MRKFPECSPDCCDPMAHMPLHCPCKCTCFLSGIRRDYRKLCKRYADVVTKRNRIWALAQPKEPRSKFSESCACPLVPLRRVEVIKLEKVIERTRTEQLAYPSPNRLMELKTHPSWSTFNVQRKLSVNRLIRKSLLSLYSRLANNHPPKPRLLPRKLTKKERFMHMKHIKQLAMPAREMEEKPAQKPQKKISRFRKKKKRGISRRLRKLARPKKYEDDTVKEWHLTPELRVYEPTQRLLVISRPKVVDITTEKDPRLIRKEALTYKATKRIIKLAEPAHYAKKNAEVKSNAFLISPKALKGRVSPRFKKLAEPKDYFDFHTRSNPYKVSEKALKAKLTKRLEQLAKPKKYAV